MKKVFIYPPTIDYDYLFQRPQQLCRALSQIHDVISIFCNVNQDGKYSAGFAYLTDSLILANGVPLSGGVDKAKQLYPDAKIIIYHSYPPNYRLVQAVPRDLLIFDALDEPENEFSHWRVAYEQAVKDADIVLASSCSLLERVKKIRGDNTSLLVPNACDYEHFAQARTESYSRPNDLPQGKPIIGFIGAVAAWLDWPLIEAAVTKFPERDFVFVGPLYGCRDVPVSAPNVHFLGHKEYKDLPAYLAYFDVCWMPFLLNQMTRGVNPIKMWECFAAGVPLVSTALPEVTPAYADIISIDCLAPLKWPDRDKTAPAIKYAEENSWMSRAKAVIDAVERKLG